MSDTVNDQAPVDVSTFIRKITDGLGDPDTPATKADIAFLLGAVIALTDAISASRSVLVNDRYREAMDACFDIIRDGVIRLSHDGETASDD